MFLKFYARSFLGLAPPATKQVSTSAESGSLSEETSAAQDNGEYPSLHEVNEADELVEKDIRDRFKKMCELYFDSVAKKLVTEHKVRLGWSYVQNIDK